MIQLVLFSVLKDFFIQLLLTQEICFIKGPVHSIAHKLDRPRTQLLNVFVLAL